MRRKILSVVGARPNFMKIAPIVAALSRRPQIESCLVHTGQHYDRAMSGLFFEQLGIPAPEVNLEVGGGSHAEQTARIMIGFEAVCVREKPTCVLVVGDVNSTIACAMVAAKLGVAVAHVEAGLRSFDRAMPEEINRILTDAISDVLFTTEESANANLAAEGVAGQRVRFVGNVMVDTLLLHRERARKSPILEQLGLAEGGRPRPYGLLTLHRPATVDDEETLRGMLGALDEVSRDLPLVFPLHPRTSQRISAYGLSCLLRGSRCVQRSGIHAIEPLGYLDFLRLMADARMVLTDSGGVQEETTVLGVPCVTLRDNTERPVTITHGTNTLGGTSPEGVLDAVRRQRERSRASQAAQAAALPPLWDGRAAERIAEVLAEGAAG